MVSKEDLAWLGGVFDGEGTITVFVWKEKNNRTHLCPTISVTNTNPRIISKCLDIFKELDVKVHIQERWTDNPKYATCWTVSSKNMTTINIVLKSIRPYLHGKRKVADMVLEFIGIRMSNESKRKPYTDYEFKLAQRAMSFNKRGVSKILTDYTQYAENIRSYKRTPKGEDIVGSHIESMRG